MLYDNALLTSVYVEAYQATGDSNFSLVARETMDYVLARMTDPKGGFYSTEDADSEGVEGKYYVWSPAEVVEVLAPSARRRFVTSTTSPSQATGKARISSTFPTR